MKYILTGQEMAAADQAASLKIGIPSIVLMERAALSVADEITKRSAPGSRIMILAGPGNNGADGIAAGRILTDRGYRVRIMLLSIKPPAADSSMYVQQHILKAYGLTPEAFDADAFRDFAPDVIVDALFGTGLGRDLEGTARAIVECVNRYKTEERVLVVGLDIPSGISSEDGRVMGCAVRCDLTVTFAYYKRGHLLYPGSTYCNETVLREIGITDLSFAQPGERTPSMYMLEREDAAARLPARDPAGNKGTFGKILIIAGSTGMCGAAVLCARAAMRSGAGMVKVFTTEANRVIVQQSLPEALLTTYAEDETAASVADKLRRDLQWADAAAIGPGLGQSERAEAILRALLETIQEGSEETFASVRLRGIVIDADALRLMAGREDLRKMVALRRKGIGCILTPHLAEFADLMHCSVPEAAAHRTSLMHSLADECRCAVTGKDARTMIAGDGCEEICLIANGNSGMATAGSGDVLTGITAALLCMAKGDAQDASKRQMQAAETAAYIHAAAGDRARNRLGEAGMIAGDIAQEAGMVIREMTQTGGEL